MISPQQLLQSQGGLRGGDDVLDREAGDLAQIRKFADFAKVVLYTDLEQVHPYYQVASEVAPLVQNGSYDKAVLICGTGAGMSVVANKYKGVYAVACEGVYSAKMARAINNANILCMGGWIVGPEMAIEMVKAFLNTAWCQDLEDWRAVNMHKFAAKVDAIEDGIYGA